MSENKSKIIVVEPQTAWLKDLEARLSPHHQVMGTSQLERALPLLRAEKDATAILVSTSKGADVIGLLETARQQRPGVLRVLLTSFENLNAIVEGLHRGAIQRVVSRPLEYAELLGAIRAGEAGFAARPASAN